MDSLFRESHLASLECFNQVLPDLKDFLYNSKMLCIGAGGLGCEILKCLALSGFREIHVIDLDTIDVTNLNRQFLFRRSDVGKYKAEVAAEFIMRRVPNVKVIPYKQKIQEFDNSFYEQFTVIIAGLDNVEARRWINQKIFEMTKRDAEGNVIPETKRFLIDGGTEGFNGQARVIEPYKSACYECTLNQLPKQVQYQMCTIANNPRLPEHCIAYVYEKWPTDKKLDKDSFEHMNWIYEQALERAKQYNIQGVTYKLTMAVVKNIIPAVAATNALIAAQCVVEAVKILTGNGTPLNNYLSWVGQANESGVNVQVIAQERIDDCSVCATQQLTLKVSLDTTVAQILELLPQNGDLYAQGGTIYTTIQGLQEHYEHLKLLTIKQLQEQDILKSNKLTCLLPKNKIIDVTLDF